MEKIINARRRPLTRSYINWDETIKGNQEHKELMKEANDILPEDIEAGADMYDRLNGKVL